MNIIICGATETGAHAAEFFASRGSNVTVVDTNLAALESLGETLDIATLTGQPAAANILKQAGASDADAIIAATEVDEVNLLCASTASYLGTDRTFATVTHSTFLDRETLDYSQIFSVDSLVCPAYSTAKAIASRLRNPAAITVEQLAGHTIEVQLFEASRGASGLGRRLADVELPAGARLAAITRGEDTYLPSGVSTVDAGDQVLLVANSDVFHEARRLFRSKDAGRRNVVIMGGSPIAVWLCRALKNRGFTIRLFETERERAEELAEKLPWVTVFQSDPTDPGVFTDEHIEHADAFVALTKDEHNILSCAWAASLGVDQTYPVVRRSDYGPFIEAMGITKTFNPQDLAVREIEQRFVRTRLTQVAELASGALSIYRIRVGRDASVIGTPLAKLDLMPDCMIVVLEHDEHNGVVPSASEVLQENDVVFAVVRRGYEQELGKLFAVK
ncbi:MAG: Trk system potassium transporter TrkA [Phycisphaerales bacterium]|jgi:trk system potassium uptake protein TrkA|nr:Trk system potassium transporter TrkA [Phycisphaerales bacterium]